MPYKVRVTDEAFRPIKATVTYTSFEGNVVGADQVPMGAVDFPLTDALLDGAFTVTFSSPGYYDFDTDKYHLAEISDITLQAKPSRTTEIVAGLSLLAIIALFFKKAV